MSNSYKLKRLDDGSKDEETVTTSSKFGREMCRCPWHDDNEPSCQVGPGDGFHCYGCRASGVIVTDAGRWRDSSSSYVGSNNNQRLDYTKLIREHIYTDLDGNPRHRTVKGYGTTGSDIHVRQNRYHQGSKKWIRTLHPQSYNCGSGEKVGQKTETFIYKYPQVHNADVEEKLFIPEGEKDADTLIEDGLLSTTIAGGAQAPWRDSYNDMIKQKTVYILPDNDKAGYKCAANRGKILKSIGKQVKLVFLTDMSDEPDKSDYTDWREGKNGVREHTVEEFRELVENAPDFDLKLLNKFGEVDTTNLIDFGETDDEWFDTLDVAETSKTKTKEPDDKIYYRTDAGNAQRFADQHGDKIRYNWDSGRWMVYDGKRWNSEEGEAVAYQSALETARDLLKEASGVKDLDEQKKIVGWAMRSQQAGSITNMLKLARNFPPIATYAKYLDTDVYYLNCSNGTLDLRIGELRPHDPSDMITKLAPFDYAPNAESVLWMECLNTWMGGDTEKIDYLQRLGGMCLTGDTSSRVFPIFYGTGKNGKSVFVDTLMRIMGDYSDVAPRNFLSVGKENKKNEIAEMKDMRFVVASESHKNMKLSSDLVKALTGDSMIKGRLLYQNSIRFRPTYKVILVTNFLPIVDTDKAIWDRIHEVEWNVRISDDQQDTRLLDKLKAEASGILKWLVEGCLKWQEDGKLVKPQAITQSTEAYREQSDQLKDFFDEHCRMEDGAKVKKSALYSKYKEWADNKFYMSQRGFNAYMQEKGFVCKNVKLDGQQSKCWIGIRLRNADDDEPEDAEDDSSSIAGQNESSEPTDAVPEVDTPEFEKAWGLI